MIMNSSPVPIQQAFKTRFNFLENEVHGQVCTVSNHEPHIRTMRLYDITEQDELIFLSRTDAQKWLDLQKCSNIAVCLVWLKIMDN
jgi:general stress protein 26